MSFIECSDLQVIRFSTRGNYGIGQVYTMGREVLSPEQPSFNSQGDINRKHLY